MEDAAIGGVDPTVDDPFASLGDDDQDATDPFTLDEEEQDITASGNRNRAPFNSTGESADFSVSRGLTSLFPDRRDGDYGQDEFERSLGDSSSSEDTSSDPEDPENAPLEAKTSQERHPLDVDDDEEMGEMVAPSEEGKIGGDEEVPTLRPKYHQISSYGSESTASRPPHLLDDGADGKDAEFQDEEEDEAEGDELVEIAMPISTTGDGKPNSIGSE